MANHLKIRRNIILFKIDCFCHRCWPLSALAIVYFQSITNSYALALGIFSISTIIQALMEVPTGIISDRVGRRMTMIAAAFFTFCSFASFALAGNFKSYLLLVLGALLWGIWASFRSGTDEAFIYDTMQELRKQHKYDIIYSQSKIFHRLGGAMASVTAICVLYFYSLHVLAWISVIPAIIQLISSFFFVEPKINSTKDVNSWEHLKHACRNIKSNTKLQKVSALVCLNRAFNMTAYRMESVYFSQLIAKWLVDLVILLRELWGAISFAIAPFVRQFGFLKVLTCSIFGNVFVRSIGFILNNALSPFIMSLYGLFLGTAETAESALLQKEFSSAQRATMGSLISLFGGFIMAISYYVFGVIADTWSVYTAILLLIIARACLGFCYIKMGHHS